MAKNILKEIAIILLLLVAITLVLWIFLSDYDPGTVTVPAKLQAYELPEEVKNEIGQKVSIESQNIIKTYTIDSSSLSVYEINDSYDKGKKQPFTSYKSTSNADNENTNATNTTTPSSSTSNNSQAENSNTTGTFFNTTGKS